MQFIFFFYNYGPLTSCDPYAHVAGTYSLATGQCFNFAQPTKTPFQVEDLFATGHLQEIALPKNLSTKTNDTFNNNTVTVLLQETYDNKRDAQKTELVDMSKSTETVMQITRANQYFPVSYIPTAIGMRVGMLIGKSSWGILQMARLTNFTFYMVIMMLSILIVPRGKFALATIGILPQSVFISSTLMFDSTIIALCALYVSIALYFIFNNKEIEIKHALFIAPLTLFIMLVKLPYGVLACLYIFMPKHIWKTKPKIITCCITLSIFAITYIVWSKNFQLVCLYSDVNYYEQMNYFSHHMISVALCCLVNSLIALLITMPFAYTQMFLFIVLIAIGILLRYQPKCGLYGVISIIITILFLFATFVFEFLTWNNYQGIASRYLIGFQERYLLPLLPLLLVMCQIDRATNLNFA